MLSEGLKDEAYRTAWGVYNVVWDKKGYWFRTPEAYQLDGMYRASMYMRPGSIWSMEMMGHSAAAQKVAPAGAAAVAAGK
jgi:non-lysosomal glucosylceramidase